MCNELIQAATDLLRHIADHNGNVYSDYSHKLHYNQKKKLNQVVKRLFEETNKAVKNANPTTGSN